MNLYDYDGFKLLHEQKESEISSVRIIVGAGSADEDKKEYYGIAHFLEHMFFKGTKDKTYQQLNNELSEIGESNAYTFHDRTVYHIDCLNDDWKKALCLLCEMLFEPLFPEDEIKKERNVVQEECQSVLDGPASYFFNVATEKIWGDIGHSVVGNKESISNYDLKKINSFRDENYCLDNIYFAVVGGATDVDEYFKSIAEKYKGYLRRKKCQWKFEGYKPLGDHCFTHTSSQSIFGLFYRGCNNADALSQKFVNDIYTSGIGGNFHSLLYNRIREELGLCYSISSFEFDMATRNNTAIYAMLDSDNVDKAKSEIIKILEDVAKHGFTDEILRISKKNVLFSLANSISTSGGYAKTFFDRFFYYGEMSYDIFKENVESITNEDVKKYANWVIEPGFQFIRMN